MTRGEALEILGLDSDASLDEAREAYRTLAKTYHPDKNSASNATVMFRIISDAWEVIQNTAAQEHSEAEIRQQQAEAEAARRRDAEEAARRRAEAAAEQKRAEEARQQAEKIHKQEKEREKKIKRYCYFFWGIPIGLVLIADFNVRLQTDSLSFSFAMWTIIYGMAIPFSGWLNGWIIIQSKRSSRYYKYCKYCRLLGVLFYINFFSILVMGFVEGFGDNSPFFMCVLFVFTMPLGVLYTWFFRGLIYIFMRSWKADRE